MTAVLSFVAACIELAAAAKSYVKAGKETGNYSLSDSISKALRIIYFPPEGILKFLKQIDHGEAIETARLEEALTNFNDREWRVRAAIDRFDFNRLVNELQLNLETVSTLNQLRDGKLDLRQEIQQEINFYGRPGIRPDRKKVRELIAAIEKLNRSIEDVEALVNARARNQIGRRT